MVSNRLSVFPTRTNYKILEAQLGRARTGHSLLRTKAKALQNALETTKKSMDTSSLDLKFRKGMALLHRAEFFGVNTSDFADECREENVRLETTIENLCGVSLPKFRIVRSEKQISVLCRGSGRLRDARKVFLDYFETLIATAEKASKVKALELNIGTVNRMINALEHLTIPRLENTLLFISNELEEQERDEFFRMKKLKAKKDSGVEAKLL